MARYPSVPGVEGRTDAADRARTLRDAGQGHVGGSFVRGPLQLAFTAPPEVDDHGRLVVWVEATEDGVPLTLDLPYIYVNPPTRMQLTDGTIEEDPLRVLQKIVSDTVVDTVVGT